jgi:hypothetical protein
MDERATQSLDALSRLLDRTTPWLSEVGSWVFGGLVAANLVMISTLLTVGPVDAAIRLAVTAFACALPLNVAGIVVLRLSKDLGDFAVDEQALQAFRESGFPDIETYFPSATERATLPRRRSGLALRYSLAIATAGAALTFAGVVAALWHMGPWIGVTFLVAAALAAGLVLIAFGHASLRRRASNPIDQTRSPRTKSDEPIKSE